MGNKISFTIEGEYVTNMARELVQEGKFHQAMELLMNCLMTDELTVREREHVAYDILNGNADLVGTYPGNDYGVEDYEGQRKGTLIGDQLEKQETALMEAKESYEQMLVKMNFLLTALFDKNRISDTLLSSISNSFKEEHHMSLFKGLPEFSYLDNVEYPKDDLLSDFLSRAERDDEGEYGWLEPNGTFHPSAWGEHDEWANKWIEEHYPKKEYPQLFTHVFPNQGEKAISGRDVLTYKFGWICIDNPAQGTGRIRQVGKPMTKAQKQFLYDYYAKRNMEKEAYRIYLEDNES